MKKEIGQRLKMIRKDVLKISSSYTLAEELGLPQSTVISYETGRNEVPCSFASKLYSRYGVLPMYLITGKGEVRDKPGKKSATVTDIANMKADIMALKAMVDYLKRHAVVSE